MVLTVSFALSPVTGLCCHRRPQETCKKLASRELDASVGASGPHDFALRKLALSSAAPPAAQISPVDLLNGRPMKGFRANKPLGRIMAAACHRNSRVSLMGSSPVHL